MNTLALIEHLFDDVFFGRTDIFWLAYSGGFFDLSIFRAFFLVEFFDARFSKKIFKNRPQAGAKFFMFFRFLKFSNQWEITPFQVGGACFFGIFGWAEPSFFEKFLFF
jgi:hypothetical protein